MVFFRVEFYNKERKKSKGRVSEYGSVQGVT